MWKETFFHFLTVCQMGVPNLAIVFAPSVIREQKETPESALMGMRQCTELVEYLVERQDELFEIMAITYQP